MKRLEPKRLRSISGGDGHCCRDYPKGTKLLENTVLSLDSKHVLYIPAQRRRGEFIPPRYEPLYD